MTNIINRHQINDYTLFEASYQPQLRQPRHTHSLASFSFVLAGSYVEKLGRQTSSRTASTVVFHPPHESHSVDFEDKTRILSVHFNFQLFTRIREHSPILDESSSHRSETICWLGNRIYREFVRMDAFSRLSIEGLVLELLAQASREKTDTCDKSIPHWLEQARDFIRDNFKDSFEFEDLVKIAGVHPVYLSRAFRKAFGCSVGEYVRRLRVEFAAQQIRTTAEPLGEIGHTAGFADHSHFNRTFKNFYNLNPSEYRKISR